MVQEAILKPEGLWTFPNVFSEAPPGALQEAMNVVLDRASVVSSRRGFKQYGTLAAAVTNALSMVAYQDKLVVHANSTSGNPDVLLYDDGTGTFTQYSGTYDVPDTTDAASRVRFYQANKNLYFTTSTGVYKLDAYNGTPALAGAPRALGGFGSTTGASGWMTDSTNVAYRILWQKKDTNGNLIRGVPSERIIVANSSGGTRDVSLTFQLPTSVTTSWTYQVYRTQMSVDLATPPDEEFFLAYESTPSAGEVTARSVTITDSKPQQLLGETLYTSPSQQGSENANYQPPFAQDACTYKNHLLLANTRQKHAASFQMVDEGSPNGMQNNDTVTFTIIGGASFTLTAKAAEDSAAGEFKLFTAGTEAENCANTMRSFIKILNAYASNTFLDGYYVSNDVDGDVGEVEIVRRDLSTTAVAITASRGTAFLPILPSAGTTVQTVNDSFQNRICISKLQEPEAFPLYRTVDIGSGAEPILRIFGLTDSVLILKADGIYQITGNAFDTASQFNVTLINNTLSLIAPNSAVVLNNRVVFMSTQGVVAISGGGVTNVSRPIERTLLELSSANFPDFSSATHATAYESDHKYILWTVTDTTDDRATRGFVFNLVTQSWTEWDRQATVGYVNPVDDKLYLGYYSVTDGAVYQERKSYDRTDYADEQYAVTITNVSGTAIAVSGTAAAISALTAGMTLVQNAVEGIIQSITPGTSTTCTLNFSSSLAYSAGVAAVYTPIAVHIMTIPITGRNPLVMKRFTQLNLIFSDASFTNIEATFSSDLTTETPSVTLVSINDTGNERLRTYMPVEVSRANYVQLQLDLEEAFTSFALNGYGLDELATQNRMK